MSTYCSPMFIDVTIAPREHRWGSFATSYLMQATAVVALVFYTVTAPTLMPLQGEHIELVAPELGLAPKPKPLKAAKAHPMRKIEPAQVAIVPPKIQAPVLQV